MIMPERYEQEQVMHYEKERWWLGRTIGDILDKNADLYPSKEALVAGSTRLTYSEMRSLCDQMAFNLLSSGFNPGDRVLLQLPNSAEFVIAHYALQKAGLVMVLLTVNHTAREIAHLAKLTQPKGWILSAEYRGKENFPLMKDVVGNVPELEKIIVIDRKKHEGYLDFNDLMKTETAPEIIKEKLSRVRPDPRAVCYLLPTGGTTNLPKCAVRTHNDYLCNVEYASLAWDINTTDISLVGTTVGHNLALLIAVSGPIFHGAKIVLIDSTRRGISVRPSRKKKSPAQVLYPH